MNYGTIFEVLKDKAIRHRVPQAEFFTVCGREMRIPATWSVKSGWNIEHSKPKEEHCKKCYPHHQSWKKNKKRRKSWA